jgi:hypothetical protein
MFMRVSPGKAQSDTVNAAKSASGQPTLFKILHCRISCGGLFLFALLACLVSSGAVAAAQEERPQIMPGERKVPRKKDAGPRAVGVLQMSANGKVSLVPIAILIDGKFWDASAYKADPVPMALDTGTVYEGERSGSSLGLFTVSAALHSNAVNLLSPWLGTGKWLPAGSEAAAAPALKAESVPAGIDPGDEPPRLTRDPTKVAQPAPAAAPSSTPPPSNAPSASGDEPPRLTKGVSPPPSNPTTGSPQADQSQPASDSTAPKKPVDSKQGDSKPSDAKPGDAKPDEPANLPASDSGATGANRPMLRRGKPAEPLPDDVVPGYSKPGAVSSAASPANAAKTAEPAADKGPVEIVPAISDATGLPPRSFGFEWLKDEEGERRAQMVTLAKQQVRVYVEARAKARITPTPKPAGPQSAKRAPAAKAKDPILENVQMKAFDVWTTNQPVLVFSADAHMPPPPAGTPYAAADSDLQYSILLVAYPDIYNNLHSVYLGVTDKFHLDLTPRLELIDAVDADGDGRGELLFREVADGGSGWVIYRPTQDKLWKMYDSLHPE